MNTSLSLPAELTIYNVAALHADWRDSLGDDVNTGPAGAEFRVRADLVEETDAAGVQLLLSLRRSVMARGGVLRVVAPSAALVAACSALGATLLLADGQTSETAS